MGLIYFVFLLLVIGMVLIIFYGSKDLLEYRSSQLYLEIMDSIEDNYIRSKNCFNNFMSRRLDAFESFECILDRADNCLLAYVLLDRIFKATKKVKSDSLRNLILKYSYLKDLFVQMLIWLFQLKKVMVGRLDRDSIKYEVESQIYVLKFLEELGNLSMGKIRKSNLKELLDPYFVEFLEGRRELYVSRENKEDIEEED